MYEQVGLGKVRWVAPSGLVGFGPLASVGPVSLGPGAAEKSSLEIPRVVVCVDPLQSLLQQKLIMQLHADQAQVHSHVDMLPSAYQSLHSALCANAISACICFTVHPA